MNRATAFFIAGMLVGQLLVGVLRASSGESWTRHDVSRVIYLLEKIADK